MSANVFFSGNLTRDPEMRQVGAQNVCRFSVAVNTSTKDKEGNYVSNYYECSLWGKRADSFMRRAQKGTVVAVAGDLVAQSYLAKDGTNKTSLAVSVNAVDVLARRKGEEGEAAQPKTKPAAQAPIEEEYVPF